MIWRLTSAAWWWVAPGRRKVTQCFDWRRSLTHSQLSNLQIRGWQFVTRPLANWRGLGKLRSAIISPPWCWSKLRELGRLKWNFYERLSIKHNISLKIVFWGKSWQKYFYAGKTGIVCPAGCISWIFAFKVNIFLIIISWFLVIAPAYLVPTVWGLEPMSLIVDPLLHLIITLLLYFSQYFVNRNPSLKTLTWAHSLLTLFSWFTKFFCSAKIQI